MQVDEIGARSALVPIPDRTCVLGLLIVVGVFDLLLEPKLVKDLKVNEAGAELFPTLPLVLEGKARACNYFLGLKGNVNTWVTGTILHPTWLAYCGYKLFNPFLVKAVKGMRGIIALLIHDRIDDLVAQAQGKEHPGDRETICSGKMRLAFCILRGAKVPCQPS